MNQVKTYIDKSKIEGIGMFAGEFIAKGTLIWKFSGLDTKYTEQEIKKMKLTKLEQLYFKRYEFGIGEDLYIFCSDNAKHCNHSDSPNTKGYPEQYAVQDINIGEEITCNYGEINDDFDKTEFEKLISYKSNYNGNLKFLVQILQKNDNIFLPSRIGFIGASYPVCVQYFDGTEKNMPVGMEGFKQMPKVFNTKKDAIKAIKGAKKMDIHSKERNKLYELVPIEIF